MTLRFVVSLLVTMALWCAAVGAQTHITLLATVVDPATGQPVETLSPADVRVTEDGVTATVVKVEPVLRSVKVQVLIDNGGGLGRNIAELRNGVRQLVEGFPADTDTTLVATAPQPRFLVRATKNRDELLKGVGRIVPQSSPGRFTESLSEAAERANKENDTFNVIIAAGSTAGDSHILETDMRRALERIRAKPMLVHVLLYSGERTSSGGVAQVEVGERAAEMTGGRYEFVNSISRYATLLPELGVDVAKQLAQNTRQFRISVQRPEGKNGDLGRVSVGVTSKTVADLRRE